MLNPDEIVESGFAALRGAQPRQSPSELTSKSRGRDARAKLTRAALASVACLAAVGVYALALRPTSAVAALRESSRLTAAQPILHVRFENLDRPRNPTSPPWPPDPPTDIWKFSGNYLRQHGNTLYEAFKDGRTLGYDRRLPEGFRSTYDARKDRFWTFDGTIREELEGAHRDPPKVHETIIDGKHFTAYEWHDIDGMHHETTSRIYVDPQTKLVCSANSDRLDPDGGTSHGSARVEYPSAAAAERDAPRFPKGLKFRTAEELLRDFRRRVDHPEQSKTLGGIRTTLYGVFIHPNVPDGLGVDVITRGGAGPDFGSGHMPQLIGAPLLSAKRTEWFPPPGDPAAARFGFFPTIEGRQYIVNQSDDLLKSAPSRITVRVPVWRLGRSLVEREGKLVHPHEFVGYVTFTTSKLFFDTGDSKVNFYGDLRDRR